MVGKFPSRIKHSMSNTNTSSSGKGTLSHVPSSLYFVQPFCRAHSFGIGGGLDLAIDSAMALYSCICSEAMWRKCSSTLCPHSCGRLRRISAMRWVFPLRRPNLFRWAWILPKSLVPFFDKEVGEEEDGGDDDDGGGDEEGCGSSLSCDGKICLWSISVSIWMLRALKRWWWGCRQHRSHRLWHQDIPVETDSNFHNRLCEVIVRHLKKTDPKKFFKTTQKKWSKSCWEKVTMLS